MCQVSSAVLSSLCSFFFPFCGVLFFCVVSCFASPLAVLSPALIACMHAPLFFFFFVRFFCWFCYWSVYLASIFRLDNTSFGFLASLVACLLAITAGLGCFARFLRCAFAWLLVSLMILPGIQRLRITPGLQKWGLWDFFVILAAFSYFFECCVVYFPGAGR